MYKRFFMMAKPWWSSIFITVFSLIAAAVLNLATPEMIRRMTALLSAPDTLTYRCVITFALLLALSYALRAVFRFLAMWQSHVAAWEFVASLTKQVYDKLQKLSMSFYGKRQTGEIMSRAINDTRTLEILIAHSLPDLFSSIVVLLLVAVMIFIINPYLALMTLIPLPFVFVISAQFSKKISPLFKINARFLARLTAHYQDRLSGIKEIKAFGEEERESEKMSELCREYANVNIRANFVNAIYQPSLEAVISMGTAIVMGVGGMLVLKNAMSAADVVGFFMYLSMFYQPLSTLARLVEDIQSAAAGGERVLELLDSSETSDDLPSARAVGKLRGKIEFDNVSFSYEGGETVLSDISFTAEAGEMIAIVGATGVGKTTIISLLERFYEPDSGRILIDNEPISAMTIRSLRENISPVLQDIFLFSGSVRDNIAFGRPDASLEDIKAAAAAAHADSFIEALPNGYDTEVGERGARLSGGQKQRIAIARAVLRDSPILIFDEATSAVDNETELEIQKAIDEMASRHTVLVIAHRLSTVMKADRIIVLENGKIAESGTHAELIKLEGVYAKLCSANDAKLGI